MAHRDDGDARRRYEIVGSNEPDDDGPLPEDSKEARGRSAMAMQAMWLRRIAIGFGVLLYGLLIALTSYLFSNYSNIATAACNRPVAAAVVAATSFLALAYQAFFFLIVLVFYDILSSTDSNFRSLQSLSEFFDMRKMPSRVLTIVFVVCLAGVFVADVIGLKYLYSDAATLQCDAIVTENGAINLWTSLATVTLFVFAFLHHALCSR